MDVKNLIFILTVFVINVTSFYIRQKYGYENQVLRKPVINRKWTRNIQNNGISKTSEKQRIQVQKSYTQRSQKQRFPNKKRRGQRKMQIRFMNKKWGLSGSQGKTKTQRQRRIRKMNNDFKKKKVANLRGKVSLTDKQSHLTFHEKSRVRNIPTLLGNKVTQTKVENQTPVQNMVTVTKEESSPTVPIVENEVQSSSGQDNTAETSNPLFSQALAVNQLGEDNIQLPGFQSNTQPIDSLTINTATNQRCGNCGFFHNPSKGVILTEGDILMKYEDYIKAYGLNPLNRTKRAIIRASGGKRWPNNMMPVDADNSFNRRDVDEVIAALREWNTYTCMRFRDTTSADRNNNVARVRFVGPGSRQGCFSFIGKQGGQQIIQLSKVCRKKRIVVHELGHAIGMFHEQSRPDRDNYIEIDFSNIRQEVQFNFRIASAAQNFGVGYDYLSIMHYSEKAFATDRSRPTIITKDSRYQKFIGKGNQLSFRDVKQANLFLRCAANCPARQCPGDAFVDKNCQCRCPSASEPSAPCSASSSGEEIGISRLPPPDPNFETVRTVENFQGVIDRLRNSNSSAPFVDQPFLG